MAKAKDITNEKFGKLLVLERAGSKNNRAMWLCKCDCGNEVIVEGTKLRLGRKTNCGCLLKEKRDLTNQKFGKLTALYPTEKRTKEKSIIWHCKCECGKECDIPIKDLISGNTKSCGCYRNKSFGEQKIKEILDSKQTEYIREYKVQGLSFKGRFDFYLPNYNTIIEYDGIQHFIEGTGKYDNKEKFKITKQHDLEKNKWCKEHNFFLIRIPYTHFQELQINDLLPETSSFIIK